MPTVTENPNGTFTVTLTAAERAALDEAVASRAVAAANAADALAGFISPEFAVLDRSSQAALIQRITAALPRLPLARLRQLERDTGQP
jgi:hypothetical protein